MSENSSEIWKDVPGYEGLYQVSNFGKVRSLPREVPCHGRGGGGTRTSPGKILGFDEAKGYLRVTLCKENKHKRFQVHNLVLAAFVGPRPDGQEGCHKDGDRKNNELTNLRWDTHSGNHEDDVANGTRTMGKRQWKAKLTDEDVAEIRRLHATGNYYLRQLGEMFGVHLGVIHSVVKRKTWKHVS